MCLWRRILLCVCPSTCATFGSLIAENCFEVYLYREYRCTDIKRGSEMMLHGTTTMDVTEITFFVTVYAALQHPSNGGKLRTHKRQTKMSNWITTLLELEKSQSIRVQFLSATTSHTSSDNIWTGRISSKMEVDAAFSSSCVPEKFLFSVIFFFFVSPSVWVFAVVVV